MTHVNCILWHVFLLLLVVTDVFSNCTTICVQYDVTPLLIVDSDSVMSLNIRYSNYQTFYRIRNDTTIKLFTSKEVCAANKPAASCNLTNITDNYGGDISVDFFCEDLEDLRGQEVALALEMQENERNCLILADSFVFQKSKKSSYTNKTG